jgi:hypothetical protein
LKPDGDWKIKLERKESFVTRNPVDSGLDTLEGAIMGVSKMAK